MTSRKLRQLNLGTKLTIGITILIVAVFAAFVAAIGYSLSDSVEMQAKKEVAEKTNLLARLIGASDKDLRTRTEELAQAFNATLKGRFELKRDVIDIKGKSTPVLAFNGHPMNLDFSIVDTFSETTGSVATIFAKSGDDFVRITTSLKNDKGERAVGSLLDREHPAYKAILAGSNYVGVATLFGRNYMTRYDPINDEAGQTIGVRFVGLDFTSFMGNLKSTIRDLKIGATGYYYVLDARPGASLGNLLVHPTLEGKNLLETKDANGKEFVRHMLDAKNGIVDYDWINKDLGENIPREKVVAFTYVKEWNWIIAGGTYTDEFTSDVRSLRNKYTILAAFLVLLTAAVLYFAIRQLISKPLSEVQKAAHKIADGDLTIALETERSDEIGELIRSINSISTSLTSVVSNVLQNSDSVANASAEIAYGNSDLSARTESQAGALEETSAAMQQLDATVNGNVAHAREANKLTQDASQVAAKGGEVMSQVIDTMKGISDASLRIADIVSIIDGIAFQTNILALNAAVEAARAGESGRGFAVVASEVRSLAARSADAAKEIKTLISDSVSRIESGRKLVDDAGLNMTDLVKRMEHVTSIVAGISAASVEQAVGIHEVAEAVIQMDQSTQQNAALVEEMAAAATSLKEQSQSLVKSVSTFIL